MKNGIRPDPNKAHPINGYDKEIYIKPTISNPNIYSPLFQIHQYLRT